MAATSLWTDWFARSSAPVPGFGFGPYAEMDLGTYLVRPEGAGAVAQLRAAYGRHRIMGAVPASGSVP